MANDNQASRTFLAIVLGGIVLALVIAAYFMYGNKGDTDVKVQLPPSEQPAQTVPPAETPPSAATPSEEPPAAEDEEPTEEPAEPPAEESTPPEEQPGQAPAPPN
ncbi:MAG TPA: hypothetical protein VFP29_04260 [Methyloceanibacter sp.]|jgi:hypothetical protein|nr:hypothetical protein [Methyloceanibacter sp.]